MTTEKLYDTIKAWRDSVTAEGMIATGAEMNNVLKQLEADMLIEQSKKSGIKSIVTAANRIIKNAESLKKPLLAGMFTNQTRDGSTLYCVCDSYVAIRFNEKPLLSEIDEKYHGQEMQLEQIVRPIYDSKEITLPDISELKVYIKTHKIKEKNNPKKVADYLLNAMECLPDCKAYTANRISPIYFKAENGDGVVMPVNHK